MNMSIYNLHVHMSEHIHANIQPVEERGQPSGIVQFPF